MVRDPVLTEMIETRAYWSYWPTPMPETVWTDDFGSLTDVMDWSETMNFAKDKWEEFLSNFSWDDEEAEFDWEFEK